MSLGHALFDKSIYQLLMRYCRWVENTEGLLGVEVGGGRRSERERVWLGKSLMMGCMISWWWYINLLMVLNIIVLMVGKESAIFEMLGCRALLVHAWIFMILRSARQHAIPHLWMIMPSDFACPSWTCEACKERTSPIFGVVTYARSISRLMIEELLDRHYFHYINTWWWELTLGLGVPLSIFLLLLDRIIPGSYLRYTTNYLALRLIN